MHINFSFLPHVVACIHNYCQRLDNKADIQHRRHKRWLYGALMVVITQTACSPRLLLHNMLALTSSLITLARAGLIQLQANTPALPLWTNPIKIQKAPMQNAGVRGMTMFLVLHISPLILSLTIRVCGEPQNLGMRPMPL